MRALTFKNAHEALPVLLDIMFRTGVERETRNGKVLQLEGPTLICYDRPLERMVFWPERDANPIFHCLEALWMLAGRNDLKFVEYYVKRMRDFSDDGETLPGGYGYRWRYQFGYDQLPLIVNQLKRDPNSRRAVLQMWDSEEGNSEPRSDLHRVESGTRDVPCNTQAYFSISNGALDMLVTNRSNDLIWGLLGANCVHFSYLLEYMAYKIGVPVGKFYTVTNNLHGYLSTIEPLRELTRQQGLATPYEIYPGREPLKTEPLIAEEKFDEDLKHLDDRNYGSSYFKNAILPIQNAYDQYKAGNLAEALAICNQIKAEDIRVACSAWIQRRIDKRKAKAEVRTMRAIDDGVNYE